MIYNNNIKTKINLSIFIVISFILLYYSIEFFILSTSSLTDENQFTEPPSKYLINKNITVFENDLINSSKKTVLRKGLFLISISDIKLNSNETPSEILQNLPNETLVPLQLYDFEEDTLLEYFAKAEVLKSDFYIYLPSAALVTMVVDNGASDRAGIKIGDLIVEINGQKFESILKADYIMRNAKIDKLVNYKIFRKDKFIDLEVQLAKFGVKYTTLILFANSIVFWLFGFILFLLRSKYKGARLLSYSFVFIGFMLSVPFKVVLNSNSDLIYKILPLIINGLGVIIYYHALSYFPYTKEKFIKSKIIHFSYYFIGLSIVIFYLLVGFGIIRMQLYADLHIATIIILLLVKIIFNKITGFKQDEFQKTIFKPLKNLYLLYFFLLIIFVVINISIISQAEFITTNKINLQLLNDIFNSLIIAFPLVHLYVILKNNIFDLHLKIRRNIKYSFSNIAWKITAFIIFIGSLWAISTLSFDLPNFRITGNSIEIINTPLKPELQSFYQKLINSLISILFFIVFIVFYRRMQQSIDKRFYRVNYDYRRVATELSNILSKNRSIKDLVEEITNELHDILHLKKIGFLVIKNGKIDCVKFIGINSNELVEFCHASSKSIHDNLLLINKEIKVNFLQEPIGKIFSDFKFNYLIPIKSKTKVFGAILLSEKKSETLFTVEDFDFVNSIASQLSVAIENSVLYEDLAEQERIKHELEIARKIQIASLPQSEPNIKNLDISGISMPAFEVGGDFYDYLIDEKSNLMLVVGDVSGKGTSAALYMSKTQGIIRTLFEFEKSPKKLLIKTNHFLHKYLEKNYFVSAIVGLFDIAESKITLSRAGHLPLYHYSNMSNQLQKIIPKGIMLGLKNEMIFDNNLDEIQFKYNSGDVFVFITDGIIEARNKSLQEFSEEKLIEIIKNNHYKSALEIKNTIIKNVEKFTENEIQYDDITLVVIKAL